MANIYDRQYMSKSDLETLEALHKQWSEADSNKKKSIHEQAEKLRAAYGYSGGSDGAQMIITNPSLFTAATAGGEYVKAVNDAAQLEIEQLAAQKADADEQALERLKQAYLSNMQNELGLDQQLKAAGISGGRSESIRASMKNSYAGEKNDILAQAAAEKSRLGTEIAKTQAATNKETAQILNEDAKSRAEYISQQHKDSYVEFDNALELYKAGLATEGTAKAMGVSLDNLKSKLAAASGAELKEMAWEMVQDGYYDPCFAQLLGYDEKVIKGYIELIKK